MESEEELADRLQEEAEQYIPFDINEVYLDFQVIKKGKEEFDRSEVM
ncbi:MAG: pilus assembly protein PilM, partial [Candidatus Electrothrix sp. AR3]|nr:pilus assembly protein PilM [Candidatus Electrothrix sp. AR3]